MIAQYGSYRHALNECAVSVENNAKFSPDLVYLGNVIRWTINGQIFADTPALLTPLGLALVQAYSIQAQDAAIFLDDGTTLSLYTLANAGSLGGVRVIQGPSFPYSEDAVYTTFLPYTIVLEAEYPAIGAQSLILQWQETVTLMGGGPRWVLQETLNGPPIRQQVVEQTKYTANQSGSAVGYLRYPNAALPIWPQACHFDHIPVVKVTPRTVGNGSGIANTEFPIFWNYDYESADPLAGQPTQRPLAIFP